MPRICNSAAEPLDFCQNCWREYCRTENMAREEFAGDELGPDGRGDCWDYQADHPPYADLQGEYECHCCGNELTYDDD